MKLHISAGDPQGIGPEITMKASESLLGEEPEISIVVHGDARSLKTMAPSVVSLARFSIEDVPMDPLAGPPPSRWGGRAAFAALQSATQAVLDDPDSALVTAPLAKEAVALEQPGFVGHTGWLAAKGGTQALMCLAAPRLRVFLLTDHVPLARVSEAIDQPKTVAVLRRARASLREDFGIPHPRIALLALNPHAGEGGLLGCEEDETLRPALDEVGGEEEGFWGPFAADSFFRPGEFDRYDGVVACYHDQGLIPLKLLGFGEAINLSAGLPFVRTSPDHGTAFDIAGTGQADSQSMLEAMRAALSILRRRRL